MKKTTYCLTKTLSLVLVFSILTTYYLLLTTRFAYGQSVNSLPLTLGNAKNEVALYPGESHRFTMRLYNKSETPIAGSLKLVDFVVDDNNGTPIFLEGEKAVTANPKYSAASWMSVPYDLLSIPPNDKVTFDISVTIPPNANPGGRYAAVIFEANSDFIPKVGGSVQQEGGSAIYPRVAGLFYITVNGDAKENALLSKFYTPSFSEYGPVKATAVIKNTGDTHIKPKGFLTVYDWFGRTLTQTKLEEENVFPEASREFVNNVGEHLMVGRYKIGLSAAYGTTGKLLEGYTYFWVIPWRMIMAIALTIAILVVLYKNWQKKNVLHQKDLEKKLSEEEKELESLKEELKRK